LQSFNTPAYILTKSYLPQPGSCKFHQNASRVRNHNHLEYLTGLTGAFDIEELVAGGKRSQCCPYYITRTVKDSADIIFCPYNYLIDPLIRDAVSYNFGVVL